MVHAGRHHVDKHKLHKSTPYSLMMACPQFYIFAARPSVIINMSHMSFNVQPGIQLQCLFTPGISFVAELLLFFVCRFNGHDFPHHRPLQVKHLEDENKKLETKLKILKEHEEYGGKIDDIVKQLENEMEEQIENLIRDQEKLQAELIRKQQEVEDTRKRFVVFSAAIFLTFFGHC